MDQPDLGGLCVTMCCCYTGNNQYRLSASNSDDLEAVFEDQLKGLPMNGYMIAMLDNWEVNTSSCRTTNLKLCDCAATSL